MQRITKAMCVSVCGVGGVVNFWAELLRITLGRLWAGVWPTFGRLWEAFGSTLGRLQIDLGPPVGRLWAVCLCVCVLVSVWACVEVCALGGDWLGE